MAHRRVYHSTLSLIVIKKKKKKKKNPTGVDHLRGILMALEFVEELLVADLELVARVREVLLLLVLLKRCQLSSSEDCSERLLSTRNSKFWILSGCRMRVLQCKYSAL